MWAQESFIYLGFRFRVSGLGFRVQGFWVPVHQALVDASTLARLVVETLPKEYLRAAIFGLPAPPYTVAKFLPVINNGVLEAGYHSGSETETKHIGQQRATEHACMAAVAGADRPPDRPTERCLIPN